MKIRSALQSFLTHSRPGVSLVELLLFVALMAFSGLVIVDLLLLASDSQARQRTVSDVEQSGIQIAQLLEYEIRHAERILTPAMNESGTVLIMQMHESEANPTLIGAVSGAIFITEGYNEYPVSDPALTISNFSVWNTSPAENRQSARVMFTVQRRTPIPTLPLYARTFDIAAWTFPDDFTVGGTCGGISCGDPVCSPQHPFWNWNVCNAGECAALSGSLVCRP